MDTLELLRSYVAGPESIPVRVDYSNYVRSTAVQNRLSSEIYLLNETFGLVTAKRMNFYFSREHELIDGITIEVVRYLGQARPGEPYQGMHKGNGIVRMLHNAERGTLRHEFMHIILGNGHHDDVKLGGKPKNCIRDRALGPERFCAEDVMEIRKKLGI